MAREYANRGWRIAPAHYELTPGRHRRNGRHRSAGDVCSCRDPRCTQPGAHPLSVDWAADATTDLGTIRYWWYGPQPWNVVLPTGDLFDVWRAPLDVASRAMESLRNAGRAVGPVAHTPTGEWLFFTDARLASVAINIPHDVPVSYHGPGEYVLAPPSRLTGAQLRWWRPPAPATLRLPRWEPIAEALLRAGRRRNIPETHEVVPVPRAG
ncbi:MAG TPA: bifunctional DNA primase/polymerase [Mycobacteriales bacterium]|nr:bifunctional DNA primase/polymerase [Mycobacteriales bacterium]